jgi:hypothetical protein
VTAVSAFLATAKLPNIRMQEGQRLELCQANTKPTNGFSTIGIALAGRFVGDVDALDN